ncbi:MAG: hypothetical protein ACREQ9_12310 [Candidatus Binatia bacterium]
MRLAEGAAASFIEDVGSTEHLFHPSGQGGCDNRLLWEGDAWRIEFEGELFFLKDSRGLRCLALLLANPGRRIAVTDLIGENGASAGGKPGGDGASLEERKTLCREQLADLRMELEEAQVHNDRGRVERILIEIEKVTDELVEAVRGEAVERARKRVSRAIHRALSKIARECPALSEHLEHALRTGTTCAYRPDPRSGVRWTCELPESD